MAQRKNHVSAIIGLSVSALCLFGFGANTFMIPTMITIIILLAMFRKPIEHMEEEITNKETTLKESTIKEIAAGKTR